MKARLFLLTTVLSIVVIALVLFVTQTNTSNTPVKVPSVVIPTTQVLVEPNLVLNSPGEYWLSLKVTIPDGYHIYSIYQEAGGPPASTIDLDSNTQATVQSDWVETPNPTVKRSDVWPGVKILQLEGVIDWTRTIRAFNPDIKPVVSGVVKVYPCGETSCLMPQEIRFTTN
jgi:hypothetical protein